MIKLYKIIIVSVFLWIWNLIIVNWGKNKNSDISEDRSEEGESDRRFEKAVLEWISRFVFFLKWIKPKPGHIVPTTEISKEL
jgi:hypothetical protein